MSANDFFNKTSKFLEGMAEGGILGGLERVCGIESERNYEDELWRDANVRRANPAMYEMYKSKKRLQKSMEMQSTLKKIAEENRIQEEKEQEKEQEKRRIQNEKLQAEQRKKQEEQVQAHNEARKKWHFIQNGSTIEDRNVILNLLQNCLRETVVIDTNIWMDDDLDYFWNELFTQCENGRHTITLLASIYEEVVRLKSGEDSKKAFKARIAHKRIMRFSNAELLLVEDLGIKANPGAYADPEIITYCQKTLGKEKKLTVFTNDNDLIFRLKYRLKNLQITVFSVSLA